MAGGAVQSPSITTTKERGAPALKQNHAALRHPCRRGRVSPRARKVGRYGAGVNTAISDVPLRRALQTAGATLAGLALVVIAGRFAGWKALVTIMPDGAPMAFVTAACFLIGGAGFLALARGWGWSAAAAGVIMVLVGGGTLALYASAESLGWERFIYHVQRPVISAGVGFDGRMSLNTAGSFVLLGGALALMARGVWRPRMLTVAAALILAVAGMALVGYASGLRSVREWWRYTAMAVPTTVAY